MNYNKLITFFFFFYTIFFPALTSYSEGSGNNFKIDLLIIGSNHYTDELARYRLFKLQNGLNTKVSYIEDILRQSEGINNAHKIRNYIKEFYKNEQIRFVLLAGGTDLIPAVIFQNSAKDVRNAVASDQFYSNLDKEFDSNNDGIYAGNADDIDYYPNVLLGRWPVSKASEIGIIINKTINYLSGKTSNDPDYYSRFLLFGFDLFKKGDGAILSDRVASSAGPGLIADKMYINSTPGMDRDMSLAKLNKGANIMFVHAHAEKNRFGVLRGWGIYSDDILASKTPVGLYFIASCENGNFAENGMVVDAMRAPLGGCVNYIGPSNLEFPNITGRMHNLFFSQLRDKQRIGVALNRARMHGFPNLSPATDSRQLYFGYNLHGDPSNYVFMQKPIYNYISEYSQVRRGNGSIDITFAYVPDYPVMVTLTADDRLIARKEVKSPQFILDYNDLQSDSAIIAISSPTIFFNKLKVSTVE